MASLLEQTILIISNKDLTKTSPNLSNKDTKDNSNQDLGDSIWPPRETSDILVLKLISVLVFILVSSQNFYYGRTLSERPCYILPLFFSSFFYSRLSWPNG